MQKKEVNDSRKKKKKKKKGQWHKTLFIDKHTHTKKIQ